MNPMVVIGIGEAGTNMATAVYKLVKEEGVDKYFQFILIDSNEDDLKRGEIPEEIRERILLELPETDIAIQEDLETFKYLHAGVRINSRGTIRQRVMARYLVDRNHDDLRRNIYKIASDFGGKHQANLTGSTNSLTIWLLHSLGGGTGSGSFPILTAMLKGIKADLTRNLGITVSVCGVGCMSTMPEDPAAPIEGDPVYYANAVAVFKELEKMFGDEVLEIPLYSKVQELGVPLRLKLEGLPFDKYFLMGINEGQLKQGIGQEWVEAYVEQKNFSIANCILALHEHVTGIENWPETGSNEYAIGSLAEHEICIPFWLLEQYVEEKKKLESKREELVNVEEEIEKKTKELKSLQAVNDSPDNVSEKIKNDVAAKVTGKLQTEVTKISEAELDDFVESEVRNLFRLEGEVFGVTLFSDRLDKMEYEGDWRKKVEELWNKHELRNEDKYKDKRELKDKDDALQEWLDKKKEEDNRWIANPPAIHMPGERRRREERLKRLKEDKRELEDIRERYEHLVTLKGKVADLRGKISKDLLDEINRKTNAKRSFEDKKRQLEDEIKAKEGDIKALEQDLSKSRFGRVGYLQLKSEKVGEITGEELERLDSLKNFVERGYMDEEDIIRGLETQINRASNWSSINIRAANSKSLFLLCNEDNKELPGGLQAQVTPEDTRTYDLRDKYTIKMCVYQMGMEISDITDFHLVKARYESGMLERIIGKKGKRVEESFAYPEWFAEDKNVREIFTKLYG